MAPHLDEDQNFQIGKISSDLETVKEFIKAQEAHNAEVNKSLAAIESAQTRQKGVIGGIVLAFTGVGIFLSYAKDYGHYLVKILKG